MIDTAVESTLSEWGERFNPETGMVSEVLHSPGYHTRIPDGEVVHSTRTNLHYAVLLLKSGDPQRNARAEKIIAKIVALQDTQPVSRTYGIWSWFVEEPLAQMAPPDWNWADFCGAALGHLLVEHAGQLSDGLLEQIRLALGHAAWAIFRRNVGPDYTNIAVMGAGVCALAGEQLGEERLLDYARGRLRRFHAHTLFHGGFNEYNSPTYTLVALYELERILQLVRDPQIREDAEALRRVTWAGIAEHFHPATAQWAGPHSRAYFDRLDADGVAYLSAMTNTQIPLHREGGDFHEIQLVRPIPCPEELRRRFQALPDQKIEIVRPFIRKRDGSIYVQGTTWLTDEVCLGTVNIDSLWAQRRPLIAYWRTAEDPVVVFRLRFLKDERDFASMYIINAQRCNRVLSAVGAAEKMGDFHLYLDAPVDGIFPAADLRLRFELNGAGAHVRQVDSRFEMAAGNWRAVVHPIQENLAGYESPRWEFGGMGNQAWVDAVCYHGGRRGFSLQELARFALVAGTELLAAGEEPAALGPIGLENKGRVHATWEGLEVDFLLGVAPPPVDTSIYGE